MKRFLAFLPILMISLAACERTITNTLVVTDTVTVHDTTTVTDTVVQALQPNFLSASSDGWNSVIGSLPYNNGEADLADFVFLPEMPAFAGVPTNTGGIPALGYYISHSANDSLALDISAHLAADYSNLVAFGFGNYRLVGRVTMINGTYPNEQITRIPLNVVGSANNDNTRINLGTFRASFVYFNAAVVRETYCYKLGTSLAYSRGVTNGFDYSFTTGLINIGCGFQGEAGGSTNMSAVNRKTVGDFADEAEAEALNEYRRRNRGS